MAGLLNSMSRIIFGDRKSSPDILLPAAKSYSNHNLTKKCRKEVIEKLLGIERHGNNNNHINRKSILKRTRSMLYPTTSNVSIKEKKCRIKRLHCPIFCDTLSEVELSLVKCPHVPRFVVDCVDYIENNYIRNEGIYRISGNTLAAASLKRSLAQNYDSFQFSTVDANTLTSLFKSFFRELNESLIPQQACEFVANKIEESEVVDKLRITVNQLPEPNRSTLRFLITHLANVALHSAQNRMTAYNLATVWGPTLLWVHRINDIGITVMIVKILIQNYAKIFHDQNTRLVFE